MKNKNKPDLYATPIQFLESLKNRREVIASGKKLSGFDDTAPGHKSTSCTWGMCYEGLNAQMGYVYLASNQKCPLDQARDEPETGPSGCFYRCMHFSRPKRFEPVSQEYALRLYDSAIEAATLEVQQAACPDPLELSKEEETAA